MEGGPDTDEQNKYIHIRYLAVIDISLINVSDRNDFRALKSALLMIGSNYSNERNSVIGRPNEQLPE